MADVAVLVKTPNFALKLTELLFNFLIICLVIDGVLLADNSSKAATIYGTMIGFFMITILLILLYVLDTPPHQIVLQVVSVAGFVMWLTSGALIINQYQKYMKVTEQRVLVAGIFGLLNSVAYLLDAALAITTATSSS